jgi:hypothetical protein
VLSFAEVRQALITRFPARVLVGAAAGVLALVDLAAVALSATAAGPRAGAAVDETRTRRPEGPPPEVVVHVSDLPPSALSEFSFWNDPASPGGKMVRTPNTGDELDPPPEEDPHVLLKVQVRRGVPYRCWVHMKVGKPKGKSQANLLYVQFTDAVDKANKEVFKPGTGSYLTAQGPAREGWTWVGCDPAGPGPSDPQVRFRTSGEVTVRLQAGMEGVGFDQVLLSPARFLKKPPSEAVVAKPER